MSIGLTPVRWVCVALAAILGSFVTGAIGLIAGATFGGNFCNTCEFNGVRGYEATGQLGFLFGGITGAVLFGWLAAGVLRRPRARRAVSHQE